MISSTDVEDLFSDKHRWGMLMAGKLPMVSDRLSGLSQFSMNFLFN